MPDLIRVIVADDESMVRSGMSLLLGLQPDIEVVGEVASGLDVLKMVMISVVDVVVMDVRMPGMDGIEATRRIVEVKPATKVLVCTTFPEDDAVYGALRAGASGFMLKFAAAEDLVAAVRRIAAGDAWLDPSVAGRVFAAVAAAPGGGLPAKKLLERITSREQEVLTLVARGLDNTAIGEQLVLSIATVKTHISRILIKTGCHDRASAVALAYESGLVTPGVWPRQYRKRT